MADKIFSDGCVRSTTPTQVYPFTTGNVNYTAGKGRFGVPAVRLVAINGSSVGVNFPGNPQKVHSLFAVQWDGAFGGTVGVWKAQDANANTVQCTMGWRADGTLALYRGDTNGTLLTSSTQSFIPNTIYQFEVESVIDNTNGYLEVRLNGSSIPIMTFSGNTRVSANNYSSRIILGTVPNSSVNAYYSDIVIFDCNGSAPNSWLGNKRVITLAPTADSATTGLNNFSTQPSQTTGNHWKNVDEVPADTSDYNFSATSGQRESYRNGGLPVAVNNISFVNTWIYAEIDDASPHTVGIAARSNSVDSIGPAINMAQSYAYYNQPFVTDPNTGSAWLNTAVNAAEFGAELLS